MQIIHTSINVGWSIYSLICVLLKSNSWDFFLMPFSNVCLLYWDNNYGEMKRSTFYNTLVCSSKSQAVWNGKELDILMVDCWPRQNALHHNVYFAHIIKKMEINFSDWTGKSPNNNQKPLLSVISQLSLFFINLRTSVTSTNMFSSIRFLGGHYNLDCGYKLQLHV